MARLDRNSPFENMRRVVNGDAELAKKIAEEELANDMLTAVRQDDYTRGENDAVDVKDFRVKGKQTASPDKHWLEQHESNQEALAKKFEGQRGPDNKK